ncbi:HD-GYP domain-containing protein [Planctomycetota bacterium]
MQDPSDSWIGESLKRWVAIPLSDEERMTRARELAHACRERVELHDPYTKEHSVRVATWVRVIASRLPTFTRERLDKLEITALVHDFGKIDVPPTIINKPGALTDGEFLEVKRHPVRGAIRLESFAPFLTMEGLLYHHVRFEGGGYPDGSCFSRGDIPLEARVIAVADTFDAITSDRSYRRGMAPMKAFEIMRAEAGRQLDPTLVRIFEDYYRTEASAKGYSPGPVTIELSATIDEEIRRARGFLRRNVGDFDWNDPLGKVADKEAFCQQAIDHLVHLTINRECAELFVRAAYKLELRETFDPDDLADVDESPRSLGTVGSGHREITLRFRNLRSHYRGHPVCVFRGELWKCVDDGRLMVLLR